MEAHEEFTVGPRQDEEACVEAQCVSDCRLSEDSGNHLASVKSRQIIDVVTRHWK